MPEKRAWTKRALSESWSRKPAVDKKAVLAM